MSEPARPLTTLQVGAGWFPDEMGGLNRVYYELWRSLPAAGVRFRGLVTGGASVAAQTSGDVRAFAPASWPLPLRLAASRAALSRAFAEADVDLVAAHFALYLYAGLRRLPERPLVFHFHGPWALESRAEGQSEWVVALKRRVERAVYERAARFIVLSAAFRDVLCSAYGVHPSRVTIVPGGVDARLFDAPESRAQARVALGWPSSRPITLCARRLVRRMGLENLLAAFADVARAAPEAYLVLLGRGPLERELKSRAEALGIADAVRFDYLPQERLPLAFRAADVSVVPSISFEGFGLVAVESLAAGTPALVTPVGGLPEAVAGLGPDVVLADSGVEAVAQGLLAAIQGRLRLPDAAACAAAGRRHDWASVAARTRAAYEEALA